MFLQVRDQVIRMISGNILSPGERMPSIHGLAKELGLSPMTVRQAYVELERAGVIRMMHGSGTFIQESALTEASGDSGTSYDVALLVPSFARFASFTSEVIVGISEECARLGINLHIFSSGNEWSRRVDGELVRSFVASGHLNGLLVAGPLSCADVEVFRQLNLPFVLLDNDHDGGGGVPVVLVDDDAAAECLFAQAFERGCRRIAMIAGPGSADGEIIRRGDKLARAYRRKFEGNDPDMLRFGEYSQETGRRLAHGLFALPEPPEAIIVNGDILTKGVMDVCAGRDIQILNYGDRDDSPCAVCAKPLFEMGQQAMKMLGMMLRGGDGYRIKLPPVELSCVNA